VLRDPRFEARFRPGLVLTTVDTRPFARGERPVTNFGMEVGDLIGDEIVRVLKGEVGAREALEQAERRVAALGPPGPRAWYARTPGVQAPPLRRRHPTGR
jgi:hypothetical protein